MISNDILLCGCGSILKNGRWDVLEFRSQQVLRLFAVGAPRLGEDNNGVLLDCRLEGTSQDVSTPSFRIHRMPYIDECLDAGHVR